jgi:hypothetical protein
MDVPADQPARAVTQRNPPGTARRARRRRPTGEAPPLPHHLQTSGVRWLIAAAALVALTIAVFARGLRGLANRVEHRRRVRRHLVRPVPGWLRHLPVAPDDRSQRGVRPAQAPQVLGFTTRAALSQRSDGRLQLEPGAA